MNGDNEKFYQDQPLSELEAEEELSSQQKLMSNVAQCFIVSNDIDEITTNAITLVGNAVECRRIFLAFYYKNSRLLTVTHQWNSGEVSLDIVGDSIPYKPGEELYEEVLALHKSRAIHKHIVASEGSYILSLFKEKEATCKSSLLTPIFYEDDLIGLLFLESDIENYKWPTSQFNLAEFLVNMFVGSYSRKRANEEITRVETLIHSVMQPIFYIDSNFEVTNFNEATYSLLGYSKDEFLEGGLEMLFGEKTYPHLTSTLWPDAFNQGQFELELPVYRKDGEVRYFSFLGVVIEIVGELQELAMIGADITDIVESKDVAEKASKAKTEFLARMSHEIRTPLNAIIGMTTISQETDDPERKKYCLEKISGASKHLLGVINDILDMSNIETNKFCLDIGEFDLENMLINISNMVSFLIDEKDHNFIIKFEPNIPRSIISDEGRLSQVIVNILSNAIKFTPENGTVSLHLAPIEAEVKDNDNDKSGYDTVNLKFTISDTGIGISKEQQSKLFQPFEQGDGGLSRQFGGTGVGLSISKNIIELMGGNIEIKSDLGEGTDVTFVVEVMRGTQNEHPHISDKINREQLRILVVDDSPDTLEYFYQLLKVNELNFDTAISGEVALGMIEVASQSSNPYNFFFVDNIMPGINGLELSKIIKDRTPMAQVIILVSAAQWGTIEKEATEVGIDDYISKPLFPSPIVDCINTRLQYTTPETGAAKGDESDEENYYDDFTGKTLLIVEDVDINSEIIIALLEDTNISMEVAENGLIAVEKFQADSSKYDLIFMDLHMPIMDGHEATRIIRNSSESNAKSIPIIAVTANAFEKDIQECKDSGMNDHIAKPVDRDVMIEKMRPWLKG